MSSRGHIIEPKNNLPRLVVWLFAITGIVALLISAAFFAPSLVDKLLGKEASNENRTWLTREWTQSPRSAEDIAATVRILEDNQIKVIYVQTSSWHGQTGDFIELPYSNDFLQRFRAQTARIDVYGWLIVENERLLEPSARRQMIEYAGFAIRERGFDGIHIQGRNIQGDNEDFISLLRAIREAVGQSVPISITVPPDRSPADPDVPISADSLSPDLTWSQDYKRRVALIVDEVVLMGHASDLTNPQDYEHWLAYQVATYATIIEELDVPMSYIIALPTYDAELGHDPAVENIETAIQGVRAGINRARSAGGQVDGVGLYPWEQTDLFELDAYWANWVKRKP